MVRVELRKGRELVNDVTVFVIPVSMVDRIVKEMNRLHPTVTKWGYIRKAAWKAGNRGEDVVRIYESGYTAKLLEKAVKASVPYTKVEV